MLPFGHLAIGILAARAWNWSFRNHRTPDWPWLLGAVLPDLIDKPVAALLPGWDHTSRGMGHTVLFFAILLAVGRGTPLALPIAGGVATHLLADLPWTYPETFWWPLLGPAFSPSYHVTWREIWQALHQPRYFIQEVGGALVLAIYLVLNVLYHRRTHKPTPLLGATGRERILQARGQSEPPETPDEETPSATEPRT